jgi:nicotinamidase/pyrazinamidase
MKILLVTDIQNDFLPQGALGIAGADAIVPLINALIPKFDHVIATMDWHPLNHVSFGLWPVHCVQNTKGAELAASLHQERIEAIFHKGTDLHIDSYSAFFDNARMHSTGLHEFLQKHAWTDLYFVGLATDYCILYSVLDALELGYRVTVIQDACRPINLHPGDEKKALERMRMHGAHFLNSRDIL